MYRLLLIILPVFLFALSDMDLKLNGYDATNEIGVPATMVEFGGNETPLCKLAISNDGKYFYLTKVHSNCIKLINRKGKKIICNKNKSVCKTRDELREFVLNRDSLSDSRSISKISDVDIKLRAYDASNIVGLPATMIEFGGDKTPLCKLAISNDGKYFYLTKVHSSCIKKINKNGKKIICNSNKSVCKTRDELKEFIRAKDTIHNRPEWCKYAHTQVEKAICNTQELADLDNKLVKLFEDVMSKLNFNDRNSLREDETHWVEARDLHCRDGYNVECIKNEYEKRLDYLSNIINKKSKVKENKVVETSSKPKRVEKKTTIKSGTGFFVNSNKVITNYHVIKGCSQILVQRIGYQSKATLYTQDTINDLAILKANKRSSEHLKFRVGKRVRVGSDILAIGYPMGNFLGNTAKLTTGNISALNGLKGDFTKMQITAPLQHGNSGGPLLDKHGNVVGVTYGGLDNSIAQNLNLVIKNNTILSFLDSLGINYETSNDITPKSNSDIYEDVNGAIVQVICK